MSKQPSVRVLSYNIHKGFNLRSHFTLKPMRDAIQSVSPDFVFLQEVQGQHLTHARNVPNWPKESQFEYLADSLWPHFAYGKNAVYDPGHHGNAILSKTPIEKFENLDISPHRFERRGLLHAVTTHPETQTRIHLLCVHLALFEFHRREQIEAICDRIREVIPSHEPILLAGDFNDWRVNASDPLEVEARLIEAFVYLHGKHPRTFPSFFPLLQLDRIYCRQLNPLSAFRLEGKDWSRLSDHLPILADFEIPVKLT